MNQEIEKHLPSLITTEENLARIIVPTQVEKGLADLGTPDQTKYIDFSVPAYEMFPNWDEKIQPLLKEDTCLVVFQSVRKPDADTELLIKADHIAHTAAMFAQGYLGYYKGDIVDGHCRSFCLWETEADAKESTKHPFHQAASRLAPQMFDIVQLDRFVLRKNEQGNLAFTLAERRKFGQDTRPTRRAI